MRTTRLRTILDLHEPSYDHPWQPRGTKCLNGIRQPVKGIRL
jgi:hypothetical protein